MRREIPRHRILVVRRERILICRDDHTGGGIVGLRQVFERDHSAPVAIAGWSVRGNVAEAAGRTNRKAARGMIADVSVDVGVNKVLAGTGKSRDGGGELSPVPRAIDIEKRKLKAGRFGCRPSQRVALSFIVQENRTMASEPLV